jgi:membrane fusion protein (multidrug efflux system)
MSKKFKPPFIWSIITLLLLCIAYWYWHSGQRYESTENAYVNAHVVRIAAQVAGQVAALHVVDNQRVIKGAALLHIDTQPFKIAVERAEAQLEQVRFQIQRTMALLDDAAALVRQREAELQNAVTNNERAQELFSKKLVSKERSDLTETQVRIAEASLDSARARLAVERANLGSSGNRNEAIRQATAALEQAQWDLRNCELVSPIAGDVINLTVRGGDVISKNQSLFAIIDLSEFWIDANFKETQLTKMAPGVEAEIRIDMYPGKVFRGKVDSISGGSGTAFSILPIQNATGNWVKITQRVPVKIKVLDPDAKFPLRMGTSSSVRVKISS